ncbi:hypothetical protein CR513_57885, partial [Mucuna pruriens]
MEGVVAKLVKEVSINPTKYVDLFSIEPCTTNNRVFVRAREWEPDLIYMYETILQDLGVTLPFNAFEAEQTKKSSEAVVVPHRTRSACLSYLIDVGLGGGCFRGSFVKPKEEGSPIVANIPSSKRGPNSASLTCACDHRARPPITSGQDFQPKDLIGPYFLLDTNKHLIRKIGLVARMEVISVFQARAKVESVRRTLDELLKDLSSVQVRLTPKEEQLAKEKEANAALKASVSFVESWYKDLEETRMDLEEGKMTIMAQHEEGFAKAVW